MHATTNVNDLALVIPAGAERRAGIQISAEGLGSRFRGNDDEEDVCINYLQRPYPFFRRVGRRSSSPPQLGQV